MAPHDLAVNDCECQIMSKPAAPLAIKMLATAPVGRDAAGASLTQRNWESNVGQQQAGVACGIGNGNAGDQQPQSRAALIQRRNP